VKQWFARKKLARRDQVNVTPGDSITLLSEGNELITVPMTRFMRIEEVGVFSDATEDGRNMICGAFIEAKP
jgi:hypothetical protein